MKDIKKIIGVIYALPRNLANKIFINHKNIFVKFMPHNTKNVQIKKGDKLLIYVSKSNKKVIGEATIKKLEFLYTKELKKKYHNKIFLNDKELNLYVAGREKKILMVLTLEKINKYPQECSIDYAITMSGKYIKKKDYNKLKKSK